MTRPIHCRGAQRRRAAAALACTALLSNAHAEDAPAEAPAPVPARAASASEAAAAGAKTLDTVVVTANRRREPVRDIPLQVTVKDAQALEAAGAKTFSDYLVGEPGIQLRSSGGAGIGQVSMRGVTTGAQALATVGVYVDDVAVGASGPTGGGATTALDMGLLDVQHLEILRGPQGTLYGASSMGGLLKYVTVEPDTYERSGKAALGVASMRRGGLGTTLQGVVNVPLSEGRAGLRVSAFRDRAVGYADTVGLAAASQVNAGETVGFRASLLLTPASRLKLRLTATHQDLQRDGTDYADRDAASGELVEGRNRRRLQHAEPYDLRLRLYAAELEYDFGLARFNAIASHQRTGAQSVSDSSQSLVPLLKAFGMDVATVYEPLTLSNRRNTQEFRLTSPAGKPLEWLLGAYLNAEQSETQQSIESSLGDGSAGPQLVKATLPATFKEQAVFGDLTWSPSAALALTAGLRHARNQQTYQQIAEGFFAGGAAPLSARSRDTSRTHLLTARYALTPSSSVYARYATGYRPGGPNAVALDIATGQPLAQDSFGPDTLVSLEGGYKADLLDRRLSVEAAFFRIDWKDIQQRLTVNGASVLINGGRARIHGAEFSAHYRLGERWVLNGAVSLLDGEFVDPAPGLGATPGSRMPDSAKASAHLGLRYSTQALGVPANLGGSLRYVGQRDAGIAGSTKVPSYRLPAYQLLDIDGQFKFAAFDLSVYVRNVFDRDAQLSASTGQVADGGTALVAHTKPRTIGVTLSKSF